jgi:hypothetical protein
MDARRVRIEEGDTVHRRRRLVREHVLDCATGGGDPDASEAVELVSAAPFVGGQVGEGGGGAPPPPRPPPGF